MADAVRHGERALELASQVGDARARRVAAASLGNILLEGHHDRALKVMTEAYEDPELTPESPGYLWVATIFAKVMMRSQRDARAVEIADAALAAADVPLPADEREEVDALLLDLLITRGTALSNLNRVSEAVVLLTGALEVARRRSDAGATSRALINLTYAVNPDDPARGFQLARDGIEETKKSGSVWGLRYVLGNALEGAIDVGEWDWVMEALADQDLSAAEPAERIWFGTFQTVIRALRGEDTEDDARRYYAESRGFDDPQYLAGGSLSLTVTHLVAGRLTEVIRLSEEILTNGIAGSEGAVFGARAAIWDGDVSGARRMRAAHEIATGGRRTTAMRETMDGGIAMLEGRPADARTHYAEAQRLLRELGLTYWLGMCDLDIVTVGAMEADERRRAGDEARTIFTRLGAKPLLDRLEGALSAETASRPAPASVQHAEASAESVGQEA